MPAESVIERLRERMRHPQSHYFTMDTADVALLLAVAEAADWLDKAVVAREAASMPGTHVEHVSQATSAVMLAVRARRAGGSDV